MKKVLVFGITDNPGGVESVIMNYYKNIDREKIQFDFLCNTTKVAYEDEIKKLGGKIFRINSRRSNRKKYVEDMKKFFKSNAHNYSSIWVNVCSLANIDYLKYAKKYGIKKRIIHAHNSKNMDSFLRGILHKINKHVIHKYATDFWSCSDGATRFFYLSKYRSNVELINNAIDLKKYEYCLSTRLQSRKELHLNDKFIIGNVGRLHFQKNQSFLIDIFNEIHKYIPNSVLVLVGEGDDRKMLIDKVNMFNLFDCVYFLGVRNDVNELMNAFDLFAFPSLFEGLPVTFIEAETSGVYTIANECCIDKKYIFSDKKTKLLPLDKDEWVNYIVKNYTKFNENRCTPSKQINKLGFNIVTEAKKIQNKL